MLKVNWSDADNMLVCFTTVNVCFPAHFKWRGNITKVPVTEHRPPSHFAIFWINKTKILASKNKSESEDPKPNQEYFWYRSGKKSWIQSFSTMVFFLFLNFLDKTQEGWEDTGLKRKARSLHFWFWTPTFWWIRYLFSLPSSNLDEKSQIFEKNSF